MNCSCCPPGEVNDLDRTFNAARAERDARRYLDKGLDRRGKRLIDNLLRQPDRPLSVLDVGCGAGGAHLELLRRGAAERVVAVDASSAYLAAARSTAERLGLSAAVSYHHADFALSPDAFEPADAVLLDRVICCYPHLDQLLGAAAARAGRFLAVSFPLDRWWLRLPVRLVDAALTLFGSGYHPFIHPEQAILAIISAAGLRPVHVARSGLWQLMVLARH